MKKFLITTLAIIIALMPPFSVSASGVANNIYSVNRKTVEFSENSMFTVEQQEVIAQKIVNNSFTSNATTYNLLCTMFGHKTTTETIGVIEHCVSSTAPRCKETLQDVTVCTRCEEVIEISTISSYYIFCCD